MQFRLDFHPDFELKIKNNLIYLIKEIQNMMYATVRSKYIFVSTADALDQLKNVKQYETESLLDYVARVKKNINVMKIYVGKGVLDYFIENNEPYINQKYVLVWQALKKDDFYNCMSYLLIRGSDQSKYGTFKRDWSLSFIWTMINIQRTSWRQWKSWITTSLAQNTRSEKRNRDHSHPEQNEKPPRKFSQKTGKNIICHCYGRTRHISTGCDLKYSNPKKDLYIYKAIQQYQ